MSTATSVSAFPQHTFESAPAASKPTLQRLKETVGMVPNLAAAMAESPKLIEGFVALRTIYQSGTFSPAEREVISLTSAVINDCEYCRAIHSLFAQKAGLCAESIRRLRAGEPLADARLRALADFARVVVRDRANVPEETMGAFLAAGYTHAQALEVVLGLATAMLANYAAHFTHPVLDEPLRAHA